MAAPMLAVIAALCMSAAPIGFAGPPGVPAKAFPPPARPVAQIVSSRWSNEDDREKVGEAAAVIAAIGPLAGKTIADIGAGDGYYEPRLSQAVGPAGRVIAQDIDRATLAALAKRLATMRLANVTVALGEPHDARLERASVDVVLMVHMYHEIAQPYALLWNLRASLKPGGRIAVVDADQPTPQHGTPAKLLACELAAVGFVRTEALTIEDGVYLAMFEKRAEPPKITACR